MRSSAVIAATTERPNIFLSVVDKKEIIEVVQDMTGCEEQFKVAVPSAVQPIVERSPSIFSPIGRRRARPPGGLTSTPK